MPRTKKVDSEVSVVSKSTVKKESVKKRSPKKKEEVPSNKYECKYCLHLIDEGMSICPNCRRNNKSNVNVTLFVVIGCIFLFAILFYHFVDKYVFNNQSYDAYVSKCVFVGYEDLVRVPKNNLDKDVYLIGKVQSVDGYDDGLYNNMTITLNLNLFDDGVENLVTVNYLDKKYEKGFITGDVLKVYGKYDTINGNIPFIEAKFIDFNN